MFKRPLIFFTFLGIIFFKPHVFASDTAQIKQIDNRAQESGIGIAESLGQHSGDKAVKSQKTTKNSPLHNNDIKPPSQAASPLKLTPSQTHTETKNLKKGSMVEKDTNDKNSHSVGFGLEDTTLEEQEDIIVLEWSRDLAKNYVESLNDGVDSFFMGAFFDDERVDDASSGSNGRVYFTTRRVQGGGVDYKVGLNLKLVLPRSRDRFKLLVETDENEDTDKESSVIGTAENVTYSTAIRVELKDGRSWKSSLDNGVRWSGEPVYFTRIRTRRTDYFETWRLRLLHSVSWRTDVEWGTRVSASLLRPIDLTCHFRTGFSADYLLSDDFANLESSAAIFDELNHRSAMLYQVAVFGDTERISKVSNTVVSVSYRRKIYKHFVFAEIVPEVAWPREEGYEATPAVNLRFEIIFGPDAL
jgi:hypothetical protein